MGMIVSVVNQKGGVGKTTTSINLATSLALMGKKVLIIDLDPQGNGSTSMGVDYASRHCTIYEVLIGKCSVQDATFKTMMDNCYIVTSTLDLSAVESEISSLEGREFFLSNKISSLRKEYDYVFIDCPPSLGMLTVNALVSSDKVIIPMQSEFLALEGLKHLLSIVSIVKKGLNRSLMIEGILLTMMDRRNRINVSVENDVRSNLGDIVFDTVVPRNIKLAEAPSYGKPALVYDSRCAGSRAYVELARELLERQGVFVDN